MSGGGVTTLLSFNGSNGDAPQRSLTLNGSTLYGMTEFGGKSYYGSPNQGDGVVFSLANKWEATPICSLPSAEPRGAAFWESDLSGSTLYGMTLNLGGPTWTANSGWGTVFSLPVGGTPTTLRGFRAALPTVIRYRHLTNLT